MRSTMEALLATPWPFLAVGGVLVALAVAAGRDPAGPVLLVGKAAPALPAATRRRLVGAVGAVGAAWMLVGVLLTLGSGETARPFWATLALVILLPTTPLGFLATAAWVARRRWGRLS